MLGLSALFPRSRAPSCATSSRLALERRLLKRVARTMLTIHKRDWLLLRGRLRAHAALKVLPCFAACSFVDATSATNEESAPSADAE